ncbi:MAG: DUF4342 domain-containing protein [Anaerolineae bacterium]
MSENQNNHNNTVDQLVQEGRGLFHKAQQRHVIVRKADGTQLLDVNVLVLGIAVIVLLMFQPLGTFVAIGTIAYGIYNKVKVEVVHEISHDEKVIEINIPENDDEETKVQ